MLLIFRGGGYWRGALISKILLFGGVLIGEGHLLESWRLLEIIREWALITSFTVLPCIGINFTYW